jgi:predicted extracellular nuclease
MSATAGKVALVSNNTLITSGTSCPSANVVDFIGYGTVTNCFEGSPTGNLSNTTAALRIAAGATDTDNNGADFAIGAPTLRNMPPPDPVQATIMQIQGAGHTSPLRGENVSTTGVVTAVAPNGFYLQDPVGDGDAATSDGIFVFTNNAPTVAIGHTVQVEGVVEEFIPGGATSGNLSITEITNPHLTALPPAPFPTATILGAGGRIPPAHIIDNDAFATFDPDQDGIDFYESLEGMLVQVNNARVVGPTNVFGETWVVGDNGPSGGTLTPRGGILISPTDFNPERIQLDDTLYPGIWPTLNVGTRFTNSPVIGIVSYSFGNFEVLVTQLVTPDTTGAVTPEITNLVGTATALTVVTFNVENLAGNATPEEFVARAAQIVMHLRSPDILVLEEMQDNDGATDSDNTDATTTFTTLIAAITGAGGPTYQFQQINPARNQDGGEPGGNIRIGFLYNPARVGFSVRPGGDATTPTTVTCHAGQQAQLSFNPGRVDPLNTAFQDSRKPLAGEFTFNGRTLYIIGNHFVSKGGDEPLFGSMQPPELASEQTRIAQAQAVHDFVNTILACNPHANIVVLGDLNDFQFSAPVQILQGDVLTNLMQALRPQERYSYVFEGNSQVLDQMLVSNNLFIPGSVEYDVVHINAEFTTQVSDHDPSVARFTFAATLCSTVGNDHPPSVLDQDIFTFAGHAGESVTITLAATGQGNTGSRATLLVFGSSLLRLDNSALPNTITATLPATGTYSLVVAEQALLAPGQRFRGHYCVTLASSQEAFHTLAATAWVEE